MERVETPGGITAEIFPARNDSTIGLVVPVKFTVSGGSAPGAFEKQVTIHTLTNRTNALTVSVSGAVVGLFKAYPLVLFFGDVTPGETVVRELTLVPVNGKASTPPSIKSPSSLLTFTVKPLDGGVRYTLSATLKAPRTALTIQDTLVVVVKGHTEPSLIVPVYAKVAANTE